VSETPKRPAKSEMRDAATVLMVRDGADGLEVFMVVRHHQIDFASGALVFPGGKVEAGDRDPALRPFARECEGLDEAAFAFRVAGIRESYEECGVLLAREAGSDRLIPAERVAALEEARAAFNRDEATMLAFLQEHDLQMACDLMVPFAHWITPDMMPKRFDTHFFIAQAPEAHLAVHDGRESVDSVWINPARALEEAETGKWTVIFPTRMNLQMLAEAANVEEALAQARARTVVTVTPWIEEVGGKPVLKIPEDAGYGAVVEPLENLA